MQGIDSLPPRFWKKVDRSGGPDSCWIWLGANIGGYPIYRNEIDRLVRRYLWFLLHGDSVKGFNIVCRLNNIRCVNPEHLVKLSTTERTQLAINRGTYKPHYSNLDAEQRLIYAARAKAAVEELGTRHKFTPEQRAKGHATRGCVPGGSGPRFRFDLPTVQRKILLKDPCVYCGAPATEIVHIQPFALGGMHDWSNRAPSCFRCNRSKSNKPLLRFLLEQRIGC